jgi:hypothetical protein
MILLLCVVPHPQFGEATEADPAEEPSLHEVLDDSQTIPDAGL